MPVLTVHDDVSEAISREMEYQTRRGRRVVLIEISPEVHERLRLLHKAPSGAVLREHDHVPVRVDPRLMGLRQWRIVTEAGVMVKELQVDRARLAGSVFVRTT